MPDEERLEGRIVLGVEWRFRYRLSLGLSAAASAEAVRVILRGSGGSVHRLSHPLQRIQVLEQAGR